MKHDKPKKFREVSYFEYDSDHECGVLLTAGMSTAYIQSKTGLTNGQISYRGKKWLISRSDFRNGRGPWAQIMLRNMKPILEHDLNHYIRSLNPLPNRKAA